MKPWPARAVALIIIIFLAGVPAVTASYGGYSVAPGEAEIHMPVQPWMLNGHRTCHGGVIFTLADSTFAFACNSRNQVTVASAAQIDFVAPGREGDVLQARAKESWRGGRAGVYDISVHRQDGTLVALFRGKSHQLAQTVLPSDAA